MKTILVTGPIGCGKSAVCSRLESKGYPVYCCDDRCKALYDEVPGLKGRIEEALGLPFSQVGRIFEDASLRERLEAVVYPLLLEDFNAWRDALASPVCFVESAVAASKPAFDGQYDGIWLVDAPFEIRAGRNPKALQRDSLQDFSAVKADVVIRNDSSLGALYEKIDKILSTGI